MLRYILSICFTLVLVSSIATAQSGSTEFSCESTDVRQLMDKEHLAVDCNSGGLTAISRLPAMRVVVFDPISRSFSFAAPCAEVSPNEDLLDRRRLALPTQKIRLVVLPYNPAAGDLRIKVTPGHGVEFDAMSITGLPTRSESQEVMTGTSSKLTDVGNPPPAGPNPVAKSLKEKVETPVVHEATKSSGKKPSVSPPSGPSPDRQSVNEFEAEYEKHEKLPDQAAVLEEFGRLGNPLLLLDIVESGFNSFGKRIADVSKGLRILRTDEACVSRHVNAVSDRIGSALTSNQLWTPLRDARLCTLVAESLRREAEIQRDRYEGCFVPKNAFEGDLGKLAEDQESVAQSLDDLKALLDGINRNVKRMEHSNRVPPTAEQEWHDQTQDFKDLLEKDQKYLDDLVKQLGEVGADTKESEKRYLSLTEKKTSQAAVLHTEVFNPLKNGDSLTVSAQGVDSDGHFLDPPLATIEIRSAPADTVRFATGLVVSRLNDPTFKLGADREVLFDDQGNGQTLPIILVHHSWGRRSGLLEATAFERFAPTFSLGIPLAKADPLTQVMFGLDWQLVSGIEVNLGAHFGKVGQLARGHHVGEKLAANNDVTGIQKKAFASALYFGIVLNSDTYKALISGRE